MPNKNANEFSGVTTSPMITAKCTPLNPPTLEQTKAAKNLSIRCVSGKRHRKPAPPLDHTPHAHPSCLPNDLAGRVRAAGSRTVQIFVKTSRTFTLELDRDARAEQILTEVEMREGWPKSLLRIVHGGKQIRPGQRLEDHGVTSKATLHVLMRLPGGASCESTWTDEEYSSDSDTEDGNEGSALQEILNAELAGAGKQSLHLEPGVTRVLGLNTDGIPKKVHLLEMGHVLRDLSASILLLGDTQRTQQNKLALECGLTDGEIAAAGPGKVEEKRFAGWDHELKHDKCKAGGVSTYLGPDVRSRTAGRKMGACATITDKRGWGRFQGKMLLGKKVNGTQRAVGVIAVYAPCPGGLTAQWQRGMLTEAGEKVTDPNTKMIRDLRDEMATHAHPDTHWIIIGDINCRLQQEEITAARKKHREEWLALMGEFGLETTEDPETPTCFPTTGTPSLIDHAMVSTGLTVSSAYKGTHTINSQAT